MKLYDCGVGLFLIIFSAVFFANLSSTGVMMSVNEPPYSCDNRAAMKRPYHHAYVKKTHPAPAWMQE